MKTKVSIIIPVYNSGKYLKSTLNSIQETISIEIIIVNDGSTDTETLLFLKSLDRKKYQVINQSNAGTAAARNNGAKHAHGEYLLFLDSDDLIEKSFCTKLSKILDNNKKIDFVYPTTILFGDEIGFWNSLEFNPTLVKYYNYFVITSLMRKNMFFRIGAFNESYKQRDDREFWIRTIKNKVTGHKGNAIFFYRKLSNSKLAQINKNKEIWKHEIDVRKKYKEIYHLTDYLNPQVFFYNTYIRFFYFVPNVLKKYLLIKNFTNFINSNKQAYLRFPVEVKESINSKLKIQTP